MDLTQQVDPFSLNGKERFFTVYVDEDTGYIPQIVLTEGGPQGVIVASVIDYENKPKRAQKPYFLAYTDENLQYFRGMQLRMIEKGYLSSSQLLP
ncbi:hypothetical protein [Alteromonas macleodii]|jgi:hypothetical protein|uniref:hypothetical protein n=1 Tax=Alteromonas macleodii TaxID=28108 RepID=UPI001930A40F|nr:hypothetical protein [Alteromonas macleodii]|tara:strand:+ start:5417 stop:5701 length:285 start_codon:yes stop_codon:yes gene_type:complete